MKPNTIINLIFLFVFINLSFAQINSNFFLYEDFKIYQNPNNFTVLKPFQYDTLEHKKSQCQARSFSVEPVFLLSNSFDVKNKKFYALDILGLNFLMNFDNFSANFIYSYGFYKNQLFSDFIDTTAQIPSFGSVEMQKFDGYFFNDIRFNLKYKLKYFTFQFGKDKTFLGDGYRSLWLSDFSSAYPFFRTTVKIWKIFYFYQISFLKDVYPKFFNKKQVPKANFTHLLAFNFWNCLSFYMFETVMSAMYNENGIYEGLQLAYLNPVIFFRSVDLSLGSPDNVIMGLGGKIAFFKNTFVYSQVFIDEFLISHYLANKGYWDEKYGFQLGFKSFKTFFKNLYSQAEFNLVRPYTFSHWDIYLAYGNKYQPLAHPLGANFKELLFRFGFFDKNFFALSKIVFSVSGIDDSLNYGKNIYKSYLTHFQDVGNYVAQGIPAKMVFFELNFGFKSKWFALEFSPLFRRLIIDNNKTDNFILTFTFRYFWDNVYWDWF